MKKLPFAAGAIAAAIVFRAGTPPAQAAERAAAPKGPRNVILFVADGLRPGSINATDAPTLTRLRAAGVWFENSHSLYPTLTMPNASGLASGHQIGDSGTFGNSLYTGFPAFDKASFKGTTPGSVTPFLEEDRVLGDLSAHFAGNSLGEESLLALARRRGFNTAAVGKVGPALVQDVTQGLPKGGEVPVPQTIVIDDRTGHEGGVPLAPATAAALEAAKLPAKSPNRSNGAEPKSRGDNGFQGTAFAPGTSAANVVQQQYFADALTKAILPLFVRDKRKRPFAVVFWSRDPDGTQHFQGDELGQLRPGINGPTSRAAVHNADTNLKQILDFIEAAPALAARTDIVVASDHGFSTISRTVVDATTPTASPAAKRTYRDAAGKPELPPNHLPAGFLALDLAAHLGLPVFDPDTQIEVAGKKAYAPVDPALEKPTADRLQRPKAGNALLGGTGAISAPTDAQVVVAANGGTDLVYVPTNAPALSKRIAEFLLRQDYVDGLFADDRLGEIPGALPLSSINLRGSARTPVPALVVALKAFSLDPADPLLSGVEVADTPLQQGQGMHGSFGRADTRNTMLAYGPDFKRGFVDRAPASNADLPVTIAKVLGLAPPSRGKLRGRVLTEALAGAAAKPALSSCGVAASLPGAGGLRTWLHYQESAGLRYLDEAKKDTTAPTWGTWVDDLACEKSK